jgi:dTDP-4-dehydrorhamnose 3,5-epimerase
VHVSGYSQASKINVFFSTVMSELRIETTTLKGLYLVHLQIFPDSRGSFRESFQTEKMEALGLPKLAPVQWNISENVRPGIIRGLHAEPWDKYVHVPAGAVFAAVADVRPDSATFGQHQTFRLDQTNALFISAGFGNAYQALAPNTVYCYLVNAHWKAGTSYPSIHYADPDLNIKWPLPPAQDDVSEKDQKNPTLREAFPEKF